MKQWKLFAAFVLAFLASACTITHFEKAIDGSYKASNYSVGMDRKDLNIKTPTGTSVSIGESNSSKSMEQVREGLTTILENIR